MKLYLITSGLIMVTCLLIVMMTVALYMRNEDRLNSQVNIAKIVLAVYTLVGAPAVVLGIPVLFSIMI